MRNKRLGTEGRIVAAIAVVLSILGGPAAQAAPSGTLVAPYESASSGHYCEPPSAGGCQPEASADKEGNLRVGASLGPVASWGGRMMYEGSAGAWASVVAVHQIESPANSVTYTVRVLVPEALASAVASACCDEPSAGEAYASLSLSATARHSACASCGGSTGWSIGAGQLAPPVSSLTVRVTNSAGGAVPAGTIRVSVSLTASAGLLLYSWSTFCCPGYGVGSASAVGEGELTSIDYEVEPASTPNELPTAAFTVSCAGRDCQFDAGGSSDSDGQITGYSWDFGDGTGSQVGPTVQHRYAEGPASYVATLTVTDDRGGTDTESRTVTPQPPNQSPTARFTVSCVKTDCTFAGGGSSDSDGQISTYSWDFGDGAGSQGASVQHRYPEGSASYVATLTVTDDRGGTDAESLIVSCVRRNQNKPTSCS